ncbi:17464_t:CDS:2 [Funneliformis geosporum]|nr:17464_t:CDS:2 [Funneliformis geosporum]
MKENSNNKSDDEEDALFDSFSTPPKAALLASLLDSRFKKMRG